MTPLALTAVALALVLATHLWESARERDSRARARRAYSRGVRDATSMAEARMNPTVLLDRLGDEPEWDPSELAAVGQGRAA